MEKLRNNKLKKKIVVCKDAGAAQLVLSYLIAKKIKFDAILEEPALSIFKEKLNKINFISYKNFSKNIAYYDEAIIGTGVKKFEITLLKKIKDKIKTKCFVDHWCFYKERFLYKKKNIFPSIIVAHDKISYLELKKNFPTQKINLIENYYWKDQIKRFKKYKKNITKNILILLSSLNENDFKPSIIFNFLKNLKNKNFNGKIILRPHPLDVKKKFTKKFPLLRNFHYEISKKREIGEDINRSDFVIGFKTSSLILAKKFKKKTFTFHSLKLLRMSVPHKTIKNINIFYKQI